MLSQTLIIRKLYLVLYQRYHPWWGVTRVSRNSTFHNVQHHSSGYPMGGIIPLELLLSDLFCSTMISSTLKWIAGKSAKVGYEVGYAVYFFIVSTTCLLARCCCNVFQTPWVASNYGLCNLDQYMLKDCQRSQAIFAIRAKLCYYFGCCCCHMWLSMLAHW